MDRLRKFWSLTGSEKLCFFEAVLLLSSSTLCVRTIAFRHIDRFLRARWNDFRPSPLDRADLIGLVERSVSRAARLMPWTSQCLSRSIATYIMLRRRGVPAVLFAGVKVSEDLSLRAHAWVAPRIEATDESSASDQYTTLVRIGPASIDS